MSTSSKSEIHSQHPDFQFFEAPAEELFRQFSGDLNRYHSGFLKNYRQQFHQFRSKIQELTFQETPAVLWQELAEYYKEMLKWLSELKYPPPDIHPGKIWDQWQQQFENCLTRFPEKIELPLPEDFWAIQSSDRFFIRGIKRIKKTEYRLRLLKQAVVNQIRRIFKKPPLPENPSHRKINLHHFLKYYLLLPLADFYLQEWQAFLQKGANQYYKMHQVTETTGIRYLFIEKFADVIRGLNTVQTETVHQVISENSDIIETLQKEMRNYNRQGNSRFRKAFETIHQNARKNWETAGTVLLPHKQMDDAAFRRKWNELQETYSGGLQAWEAHFRGENEEWQKDIELIIYQLEIALLCLNTLEIIRNKIHVKILPAIKEAYEPLKKSTGIFRKFKSTNRNKLKSIIISESHSLLRMLRLEKLPVMMDSVSQAGLEQTVRGFLTQIRSQLNLISEQHIIFKFRDLEHPVPESTIETVDLKELVESEILDRQEELIREFLNEIIVRSEKMARKISEIDQVVEFNLDAALNLLKEEETDDSLKQAQKMVIEGLERTRGQIDDLVELLLDISRHISHRLPEITREMTGEIQKLEENEKIFEIKFRVARAKTREEIRKWRGIVLDWLKSAFPALMLLVVKAFQKIRAGYLRLRKVTGLAPTAEDVEEKFIKFLSETRSRMSQLPYVYQRLFRLEPLNDNRFYIGRNAQMEVIKNDFEDWRNGNFVITAVIGEKGSGRTTFLNFTEIRVFKSYPILKIQNSEIITTEDRLFELLKNSFKNCEANSLEEIEEWISSRETKMVCIMEDIQNFFLRTVRGFEALERLLLFLSRTYRQIFWVVSCTKYSWLYLDRVVNISGNFLRKIFLDALSKEDMENIILKRHRVSGYDLIFEIPDDLKTSRRFKKIVKHDAQQEYLKDRFFDKLNELSAGNIRTAILFWLSAIMKIEKDELYISSRMEFDFAILSLLPSEELFTLAAVIQHEVLNPEQHSFIFHQDLQVSHLIFNRLFNRGFLEKTPRGFQIHPFLYRPVVKALSARNILHS